jgi:hypothetical protein
MEKLKVGDEVYRLSVSRFGGERGYTFDKVERITKTLAVLVSGVKVRNEPIVRQNAPTFYSKGNGYYFILTDSIREDAKNEELLKEASNWFWSKYEGRNPPREDLLLIKNFFEQLEAKTE